MDSQSALGSVLGKRERERPLMEYQKEAVEEMLRREATCTAAQPDGSRTAHTRVGILGNPVGTGKTRTLLAMIIEAMARGIEKPSPPPIARCDVRRSGSTLWVQRGNAQPPRPPKRTTYASLVIVPHKLGQHWAKEMDEMGVSYVDVLVPAAARRVAKHLGVLAAFAAAVATGDLFESASASELAAARRTREALEAADVVLLANHVYYEVINQANLAGFVWNRVVVDEADSIHFKARIVRSNGRHLLYPERPAAEFYWLISATWRKLRHLHANKYVQMIADTDIEEGDGADRRQNAFVVRSDPGAIAREWVRLRPPVRDVECRAEGVLHAINNEEVHDLLQPSVVHALHAGDMPAAVRALGGEVNTPAGFLDAFRARIARMVRDHRARIATLEARIEHPRAPDASIEAIVRIVGAARYEIVRHEQTIARLETRLEAFRAAMEALERPATAAAADVDICMVCLEEFDVDNGTAILPCCSKLMHLSCLQRMAEHAGARPIACPQCNAPVRGAALGLIARASAPEAAAEPQPRPQPEPIGPPTKKAWMREFLRRMGDGDRVIVSAESDGGFAAIREFLEESATPYLMLKGAGSRIAHKLAQYDAGAARVILLNGIYSGAGFNLPSTTDVVFYHRHDEAREEQVVGRATRLGRNPDRPLRVYRLLHPYE